MSPSIIQSFQILYSGISFHAFMATLAPVLPTLVTISPIVLVFILFIIFWDVWVKYIRAEFLFTQKNVLLDIRLPREQMKSPKAMELFLASLHITGGETTFFDKYWFGKVRAGFSLEIVSIEGQIHFFIWTRESMKNFVEANLYSHFPGIEVHVVDDYARSVNYNKNEMGVWGCEFKLRKSDAYPIKTYVDYGLDEDPKEEFKIDPIVPLIEFLGSLGPNQQLWIQYIIRAHLKDTKKSKGFLRSEMIDGWKDRANEEVSKILVRDAKTKVAGKPGKDGVGQRVTISPGEQDIVKAIERNISKPGFDICIRCVYMAKNDFFVGPNIGGLIATFKETFLSENLNSFGLNGKKWGARWDYPWQDYHEIRQNKMRKKLIETYKRRVYFYEPYVGEDFFNRLYNFFFPFIHSRGQVMNTESLATIYHFPGSAAATPTLSRIPSKKGQAPANLPI